MADGAVAKAEPHYQDFILQRELAEVYLLLDNLSGSATKDLEDARDGAPKLVSRDGAPRDWIEAVCDIAWPPTGTSDDEAHDISTLIRVRDYLNRRAWPANGSTIAFTLPVAGEGRDEPKRAAKTAAATTAAVGGPGWRNREPPSRVELANLAFPQLSQRARTFKN